jgi:hypothetical protein
MELLKHMFYMLSMRIMMQYILDSSSNSVMHICHIEREDHALWCVSPSHKMWYDHQLE